MLIAERERRVQKVAGSSAIPDITFVTRMTCDGRYEADHVVTGTAGEGAGQAILERFAGEGANCVVSDSRSTGGGRLDDDLAQRTKVVRRCRVRRATGPRADLQGRRAFGGVDILVTMPASGS